MFVTQSPGSLNLTSMGDMAALGISVDGDRLSLSEAWQPAQPGPGDAGLPDGFAEYTLAGAHGGEDMSIVVQKSILENHNG